jgi:hypothetical protein
MSKAPLPLPIAIGRSPETTHRSTRSCGVESTQRRFWPDRRDLVGNNPPRWLRPVLAGVVLLPFVLTAVGLTAVAARSVRQTAIESAYHQPNRPTTELVANTPIEVAPAIPVPVPPPVEPGEARPPLPGSQKTQPEAPIVSDSEIVTEGVPVVSAKSPRCDRFGTAIDFVRSPALAYAQAANEQKLVLVLHLAGHFEDPGFT